MTREQLFDMALRLGVMDDKEKALHLIREELGQYFNSEEGINFLRNSPTVYVEGNSNFPLQQGHVDVIVDLLIQEVIDYDFN